MGEALFRFSFGFAVILYYLRLVLLSEMFCWQGRKCKLDIFLKSEIITAFLCKNITNTYSLNTPFFYAIIKLIREEKISFGNKFREVKIMCGFDFSCILEIIRGCFTSCGK